MSEQKAPVIPHPSAIQQQDPVFALQRAYLKGASLELPGFPDVLRLQTPPHIDVNLNVAVNELEPAFFEVVVRATVSMRRDQADPKVLMLLEADQAGIFEVRNLTKEQVAEVLEIGAPAILTPYLRVAISDIMTRATLPPFYVPEINWAMVRAHRQQNAAANDGAPAQLH